MATGCKKTPVKPTTIPITKSGSPDIGNTRPIETKGGDRDLLGGPIGASPRGIHDGWLEDAHIFEAQTVHFDFDSSTVKQAEMSKLEFVASHMKSDAACAIKIEGHCDERGTEEYNRSLGERRAQSLREELVRKFGIAPDRIDTITYGEDRPVAVGHDEAAYRQNRRGVFILLTPPK